MSATPDRDDRVAQLLTEIRDQQREQLALSRESLAATKEAVALATNEARIAAEATERSIRNQEQSMAAQARAIELQQRSARLYRIVVSIAGLLGLFALGFLARLISRYS
jgi:hypothetical protein